MYNGKGYLFLSLFYSIYSFIYFRFLLHAVHSGVIFQDNMLQNPVFIVEPSPTIYDNNSKAKLRCLAMYVYCVVYTV